jgi:hypothetical protein
MALKQNKSKFIQAEGIDSAIVTPISNASSILNMRLDTSLGGWINDRGLLPYWKFPSTFSWGGSLHYFEEKVDSFFIWKKPGSGQVYHFVEQGGYLYYFLGNKGQGSTYSGSAYYDNDIFEIDSGRNIPRKNEAGTQYIPFGKKLLILNGVDKPIWFQGADNWRDFSFTIPTPSIDPITIQPTYTQNEQLLSGTGTPYFLSTEPIGLGDTTGDTNLYYYKFSYITEDGAESPLSSAEGIEWAVPQEPAEGGEYKFGITINLPICTEACAARRLYRTKNVRVDNDASAQPQVFYFLKQINENCSDFYIDYFADTSLITEAPSNLSSSIINTDFAFGENWDGRMWLAKGDLLIYSDKGIPEQFPQLNQFDLGNLDGGDITQIQSYYNNLIVFRENAINIVRPDGRGGYTFGTISSSVGTLAANSVHLNPRQGLMFANIEGIWVLSGGLDGGSLITINKISNFIDDEWAEINQAAIAKVVAAYSPKEEESWFHYPTGYEEVPSKGVIVHTAYQKPQFSIRAAQDEADDILFYFSAIGTDVNGNFVLGAKPTLTDARNIGSETSLFGPLHVWCANPYWSQTATVTNNEDGLTWSVAETNWIQAEWESAWIHFELGAVRIFSVELELIARGDTDLKLFYYKDHEVADQVTPVQKQAESKVVFTLEEPPVTVGSSFSTITKNPFVIETSQIHGARKIRLRFDVNTGLVNQFKFKVQGDQPVPFQLLGFRLNTAGESMSILNQAINIQASQPR